MDGQRRVNRLLFWGARAGALLDFRGVDACAAARSVASVTRLPSRAESGPNSGRCDVKRLGPWFKRMSRHPAAGRTAWMMAGYAVRLGCQTIVFIWVARLLGPGAFGAFAASMALANLLTPFVDLGAYSLII